MDNKSLLEMADVLSVYSYKIEAILNLLMEKNVFNKEELNNMLIKVMDEVEEAPNVDEYVIEEMKKKIIYK